MNLTNAAGTAKTVEAATEALRTGAERVVLGSFAWQGRQGNPGIVDFFDDPAYSLNVRGIPSPPAEVWWATVAKVAAQPVGKLVTVSVAAFDPAEYEDLAQAAYQAGAVVSSRAVICGTTRRSEPSPVKRPRSCYGKGSAHLTGSWANSD